MNLEVLSSRECATLCRAAAFLVLSRFHWLAQRTDPEDLQLTRLLQDLGVYLELNLVEIRQLEGQDEVPGFSEEQMGQRVARGFLPSLSANIREGRLDHEAALYLVECILGDLAGFYGAMVRQTCDERARELIQRSKQAVSARLEFLRRVVL